MRRIPDLILKFISMILVYGILAVIVIGVFYRFILNHPVMWTEELGSIILIFVVFIGAGLSFYNGEMVKMDFILARLPAKARTIMQFIFDIIITVSSLFLIWPAVQFLQRFSRVKTVILRISYAVSFSATLIVLVMFFVVGIIKIYFTLKKIRSHELWK